MALTDLKIKGLKPSDKPQKVADGGGLFIYIVPTGSKLWRMRYRFDGKEQTLTFGAYPEVSLAKAREKRAEAKVLLAGGIDPRAKAKADEEERAALTEHTFANIAAEVLAKNEKEGKAPSTLKKKRWLLNMAIADFGSKPITKIKASDILPTFRKVEAKGNYESAKKLRTYTGQVFRYAVATGRAENDPTFALKGALIAPKVTHMAAVTDRAEFGKLVRAVWAYEGSGPIIQSAMRLLVLLYSRPGELRLARWNEFDLEKAVWTIPLERSKLRRVHVKPLSGLAIEILRELHEYSGDGEFVFPSLLSRGKAISENTLNQILRRLGFTKEQATSHGFRSSASSLLNESGLWNADAVEAELDHLDKDQVRSAYHRARYWDERVRMADWWAGEIVLMTGLN